MRRILGTMVTLLLGLFLVCVLVSVGCAPHWACNPKEVNTVVDSLYAYHLAPNQKTLHLSVSNHEIAVWTFDQDTTVDSVSAVFGGLSPFASHHFEFSDSAAFSGPPVVAPGPTVYPYTITVYPHGHAPVTVDPGIIIDT